MSDTTTRPTSAATALVQQAIASLNRNDADSAEVSLSQALALLPDDANALQLMAVVRRLQGRAGEAESYYRRVIAQHPSMSQAHHNLGNFLADERRYDAAIDEQREAIRLKPNFAQAHLGLALALSAMGDHASAAKSCTQALRLQPNFLSAKMTLAGELNELGRPKEAERILRQMLTLGTSDTRMVATIEHNLGVALKQQGRLDEALLLFEAARNRAPGMPTVDYNHGDTLQRLGRLEEAFESFRRAIEIEPHDVDALALAALIAARLDDFEHARAYGARALAIHANNGVALVALAIADIGAGDFAAAESTLQRVLDDVHTSSQSQTNFALGFAADALDCCGKASSAFTVYTGSNERRRQRAVPTYEAARAIGDVARLMRYFERTGRWTASPVPPPHSNAAAGHVFLLGFMRSGTTLLTSALAGNSRVIASDEREYLTASARAFLLSEEGLNQLETADDRELVRWQEDYWSSVRAAGLDVAGKVFVDKMPFNSLRLPLIARLFPGAKVLFALRDPRDVILSCFRRRFDMTPYSFEFLRLEDCARFYAATMALAERYRDRLPLDLAEFRYEDLIVDCRSSLQRICDFIEIERQDSMLDLVGAATSVDRRSASLPQVRRGLYKDGVGQWRRYREQLTPVLSILQPWIERFGYPSQ